MKSVLIGTLWHKICKSQVANMKPILKTFYVGPDSFFNSFAPREDAKNKNPPTSFNWLLLALFVKELAYSDTHYCEFWGLTG